MTTVFEQVTEWFDWFKARPMERRLYFKIPAERVKDDPQPELISGSAYEPENSYYSVRIVELYLRNAGEYFRQFLPMAVTLMEYTRNGEPRSIPYFVNNDKLREAIGSVGAGLGLVQMQNVYAMRLVPANAGGLSLFCGLFRVVHANFAAALLDLLADVGSQLGGEALARGTDVARTIYSRLSRIVGMQDVEFRFGQLDGSALNGGSGYRVFAGDAETEIKAEDLWIVNGQLHRKHSNSKLLPVTEFDYCVIALEHVSSRAQLGMLANLPLHKQWNAVVPHLAKQQMPEAEAEFQKLQAEILLTPDLTEMDRLVALGVYQKRWVDIAEKLSGAPTRSQVTGLRGPAESFRHGLIQAEEAERETGEKTVADTAKAIRIQLRDEKIRGFDPKSGDAVDQEAVAMAKILQKADRRLGSAARLASVLTAARVRSSLALS